ncbi:hypothetical protein HOLleu_11149 [Holothuria leucospilota]|uniref:Uncharacterized protein n=1 Tax=Holothuria leucospilota TaxID=206669 RepID=A0A9Q1HG79_HOLLE|nr:hypothetical protein HOLleu_11149 [Holothuria leucospilota]
MEVTREANVKEIDKSVRDKWNWKWLEEKDRDGYFLSDYIRKIDRPGLARCIVCNCDLKYANGGKRDLVAHGNKKKHIKNRKVFTTNSTLPSIFERTAMRKGSIAVREVKTKSLSTARLSTPSCPDISTPGTSANTTPCGSNIPYGAPPNVHNAASCSGKVESKLTPNACYLDRKGNAEAMVVSFVAEHSLPFAVVPHILDLSKELARDNTVLQDLSMERTTCAYKLKEGVAEVVHKRLVHELKEKPFSINLDECTAKGSISVFSLYSYHSFQIPWVISPQPLPFFI